MTHRYSYSQIQKYASCPTAYKFRYVDCLMPIGGESEHDLRFGRAIDAALSAYYLNNLSVVEAKSAFILAYPESEYPVALPYWSPGKTFANGLAAIIAYDQRWQEDSQYWEVIAVQSSQQSEDIENDRLVKIDLVIKDRRDGLIYGVDFKSTGKYLDKDFSAKFDPHSQIRQYVDRLQRKYETIGGFYIDALSFRHRTKAYTPRKGPDKGIQLPAGDWYDFKRLVFNPNSDAIQAERDNFDAWVERIEHSKTSGRWSYNTEQCVRGPIICEYYQICSSGYSWPRDQQLIESHYRRRCIRLAKNGERCQLEPEHEGEHDATKVAIQDYQIDFSESEIEDAIR